MPKKELYNGTKTKDENGLTPKQQVFVAAYTNPGTETFMNGAKSAGVASPMLSDRYRALVAYRWKNKPAVQNAIQEQLENQGFGMDRRLQVLAEIGNGVARTTRETVTKTGQVVEVEVRPSIKERLQAIDLANKIDGTYSQQKIDIEVARDEAAKLHKKIIKDVTGS